jgi:hypothetical protein
MNAKFNGHGDPYVALNQFIIPKKLYLESGGYDESFVPFHTGDREFLSRLSSSYDTKNLEWLNLTCRRGGRKAVIVDDAAIPVYDDEKMIFYTRKFDPTNITPIEQRINFDWERVL